MNATLPADSENPMLRKNPSIAEANTIEGVPSFSPVVTFVTPLADTEATQISEITASKHSINIAP